jgi:SNF2 family DNA or RNA helicase
MSILLCFFEFAQPLILGCRQNMKTLILRNDVKRNFQTVLVMLLRLRQTCNHMLLATGLNGGNIVDASVASSASLALHQAAAAAKLPFSSIELPVDDDLSLQMSSMRLDESELESSLDDFESSSCVADADAQSNLAQVSSTKIQWLMRELQRIRTDAPSDKCVIFSQWSSMLNIIQHHLQESKLGFVRLDGDCKISERSQALDSFAESEPAEVFVILVSLKCGGTGLNLTRANHAFMMDSWFNRAFTHGFFSDGSDLSFCFISVSASIEEQAFDRIYRIGQTKPTFCHKLMISGSVEEKILQMQQRKQKVASKALNSDAAGKKKSIDKVQFSFDDVKSLFF